MTTNPKVAKLRAPLGNMTHTLSLLIIGLAIAIELGVVPGVNRNARVLSLALLVIGGLLFWSAQTVSPPQNTSSPPGLPRPFLAKKQKDVIPSKPTELSEPIAAPKASKRLQSSGQCDPVNCSPFFGPIFFPMGMLMDDFQNNAGLNVKLHPILFLMRNEKHDEAENALSDVLRSSLPPGYAALFHVLRGQTQMAQQKMDDAVDSFDRAMDFYKQSNTKQEHHFIRTTLLKQIALAQSGNINFSNFATWKNKLQNSNRDFNRELALIELHLAWDAKRRGDEDVATTYVERVKKRYLPVFSPIDQASAAAIRNLIREVER